MRNRGVDGGLLLGLVASSYCKATIQSPSSSSGRRALKRRWAGGQIPSFKERHGRKRPRQQKRPRRPQGRPWARDAAAPGCPK
eukprot:6421681-Amphidinium_carterae.1